MATCKIDRESSATFRRCLRELSKKYRHASTDFDALASAVERDYKEACNAFCVPMPGYPELQRRVWKYDFKSTDLRKHPRDCFRFIGLIDNPDAQAATMVALFCYFKGDVANLSPKEIHELVKRFKASLEASASDD